MTFDWCHAEIGSQLDGWIKAGIVAGEMKLKSLWKHSDQGYKNFGTGVGLNVTVPIYDGKQKKMQYRKLDLSERARRNYKSFYTSQYYQQIYLLQQQLQQNQMHYR